MQNNQRIALKATGFIFLFLIVNTALLALFSSLGFNLRDYSNPEILLFASLYTLFVTLFSLGAWKVTTGEKIRKLGWSTKNLGRTLLSAFWLITGFWLFLYILKAFHILEYHWLPFSRIFSFQYTAVNMILMFLTVGFCEELFFRGFIYGSLSRINSKAAAVTSSLIFIFVHFIQSPFSWIYLLELSIATLLFLYLYVRTASLVPGMIVHAFIDISLAMFSNDFDRGTFIQWDWLDLRLNIHPLWLTIGILVQVPLFFLFSKRMTEPQ